LWTQSTAGVPGTDEKGDSFGLTLAAGDVNGDGRSDLIIGMPLEDIGSAADAGAITYLAGAPAGPTATGSVSYSQNTAGVPGTAEPGDEFGSSIAVGDVNGDGRGDTAVGTPSEDIGSIVDGGSVTVLAGSSSGPTATGSVSWDQDSPGIAGVVETSDEFGYAVYPANITSTGHADLVIGVPFESTGSADFDGALNLIPGSPRGLIATGSQYFGEPTDVAPQQPDDVWGAALA
ncbi:MAG TPA: FG-GAP repeat protein, partial [Micromonosporaceae bacterium]